MSEILQIQYLTVKKITFLFPPTHPSFPSQMPTWFGMSHFPPSILLNLPHVPNFSFPFSNAPSIPVSTFKPPSFTFSNHKAFLWSKKPPPPKKKVAFARRKTTPFVYDWSYVWTSYGGKQWGKWLLQCVISKRGACKYELFGDELILSCWLCSISN